MANAPLFLWSIFDYFCDGLNLTIYRNGKNAWRGSRQRYTYRIWLIQNGTYFRKQTNLSNRISASSSVIIDIEALLSGKTSMQTFSAWVSSLLHGSIQITPFLKIFSWYHIWGMSARARPSQREKTAFRNKVQHIKACGELVCIADEEWVLLKKKHRTIWIRQKG